MPDQGTAYDMPPTTYNRELTEVGRRTPMGELPRRYWHPIGPSSDAGGTPRRGRALGEDLILFRDAKDRPGLMHARCCHRGTTLYYGKVEPEGGRQRVKIRQPWYPVRERYGPIFANTGPPAKKPVLPRYECLDVMDEGEFVEADDSSIGGGGPEIVPGNWLRHFENVVDPPHVPILHDGFSGMQFTNAMAPMPNVTFETIAMPRRLLRRQMRAVADGRDPAGVSFDPDAPPIVFEASNRIEPTRTESG